MTKKQFAAIYRANKALEKPHEAGITICGMDGDLLWATKKALKNKKTVFMCNHGEYPDVAQSYREFYNDENGLWEEVGQLYSEGYEGSGGW